MRTPWRLSFIKVAAWPCQKKVFEWQHGYSWEILYYWDSVPSTCVSERLDWAESRKREAPKRYRMKKIEVFFVWKLMECCNLWLLWDTKIYVLLRGPTLNAWPRKLGYFSKFVYFVKPCWYKILDRCMMHSKNAEFVSTETARFCALSFHFCVRLKSKQTETTITTKKMSLVSWVEIFDISFVLWN